MKVTIIGAGNMGSAIAKALLKSSTIDTKSITISDKDTERLKQLKLFSQDFITTNSNEQAIKNADLIIVAVKPWHIEHVATQISKKIDYKNQIILSIAANINTRQLKTYFQEDAIIFRMIPNTAIEVWQGVNIITSTNSTDKQIAKIKSIFDETGKTFIVNENELNAYMALSSCGIAYAFRYLRAATEGAVEIGIQPNIAKDVIMQTLRGAIELLETHQSHPEAEIDKVTTPGGITIKGLNEMEANGFSNAVIKGIKKSLIEP